MTTPYEILARKRSGASLSREQIRAVVRGAADGSWSDARLAAFLMATAIRGLDRDETHELTVAMLESGDQWRLRDEFPTVGDKHSTGGVGDKISIVLAPLLAACSQPVVMLTGRGLGHTAGTADKLDSIPGLDQGLDRERSVRLLAETGVAIGMATTDVAPADKRLYGLRDHTATVESLPLVTASILSKKLAVGPAAVVFDVKTGSGAFFPEVERARELARLLVDTSRGLGTPASALITDMSQPLGRWVGHNCELRESLDCLEGTGPRDILEVTFALGEALAAMTGVELERRDLEAAIESGRARELFDRWATAQGADPAWLAAPRLPLAPAEMVLEAPRAGVVAAVDTRSIGLLLAGAGGGRVAAESEIDPTVSFRWSTALGDRVEGGDELGRLYLRDRDEALARKFLATITIAETGKLSHRVLETVS